MVIWSGRGWVPVALLLGVGAIVQALVEAQLSVRYQAWPLSLVLALTGAASLVLGRAWNPPGKPAAHTLFWIPLQWWGLLLTAFALLNVVASAS